MTRSVYRRQVPPNDLLRGLYDLLNEDPRTHGDVARDIDVKPDTIRKWWHATPRTIRLLMKLSETLGYRLMFVSYDHPLSVVSRPIIRAPFPGHDPKTGP